jgi:hypothetical protein
MEIFYTLLSIRGAFKYVPLIITYKIWYTSTYHDVHYDGAKSKNCVVEKFCTKGSQSLLSLLGRR